MRRLCGATLAALPPGVGRPRYDRARVEPGIVHVGPGAFHRVHEAWYAQQWLATDPRWGIAALSLRSAALRDALAGQDWLYTLAELDEQQSFEVVGSLRSVQVVDEAPALALERIASPSTRMITLTVTEKGYCLDGTGLLDLQRAEVSHDLAHPRSPVSAVGLIVAGLALRRERGLRGVPVVSCDNLSGNGRLLAAALVRFATARDRDLAEWIGAEAHCPCTMVDSITPATTPELRRKVTEVTGLEDRWPVQRERFVQWVVEVHEARESPDWAAAGVVVTDDVSGYERAKLRILNGAHSTLAYLGLLRGHATVAEAMGDSDLAGFVQTLIAEDIVPTLAPVRGLDIADYSAAVLRRFRNPALRHELAQIAWDGSQKLPIRLLGTVRDALDAGRPVDRPCATLAAWMHFVRRRAAAGVAIVDPLAERLARLAREQTTGDAAGDVAAFLALGEVFPRDLAAVPALRRALESAYAKLAESPGASLT